MPQNYGRRESENQSEWRYGDRRPYPYDTSTQQPGRNSEGWGWNETYAAQHESHQPHAQYAQGGGQSQPWSSPNYIGQQQHGGYQRQHSSSQHGAQQAGFVYPHQQHEQQHEQYEQQQHHQAQRRPSMQYQPQLSSGVWSPAQESTREAGANDAGQPQQQQHEGHGQPRRDSHAGSAGEENWDAYNDCWSGCGRKLTPHLEVFNMLSKGEGESAGPGRTNYKKQNNFLMKVLFDESGECAYHVDCVLRTFKISKGRLKRLQERIKRELRGELTRHGLFGRPSNNRKKPETLRQFTDFVKANRVEAPRDDNPKVKFMLPPQITSIQGDCPGSLKTQFDKHQIEMSTDTVPRELVSSGTAQSWFKKYFDDTLPPSGPHSGGPGSAMDSAVPDDDEVSMSSDIAPTASGSTGASAAPHEKRPGSSHQAKGPRKRLRVDRSERELDENDSTDGTASTGNVSSDMQSQTESHDGNSGKNGSSASDSGLGSIDGNNNRPHVHKTHPHPHRASHHVHAPKKKPGSDSDGSVIVESPELD